MNVILAAVLVLAALAFNDGVNAVSVGIVALVVNLVSGVVVARQLR